MTHQTDLEIIRTILAGQNDNYRIIVERYADQLLNLCYRYLYREAEAQDATQEIFLKAYYNLNRWEPHAQFNTWLYRIAINHCLNILRRRKILQFQSLQGNRGLSSRLEDSSNQNLEKRLIEQEQEEQLKSYINRLPENQRSVIILYFYQELSYKEISQTLQISLSSVESRLFRAKKNLAKIIRKENTK